jgi:hypothetical protein
MVDRHGLEAACCECYAIVRRFSGDPFEGSMAEPASERRPE